MLVGNKKNNNKRNLPKEIKKRITDWQNNVVDEERVENTSQKPRKDNNEE